MIIRYILKKSACVEYLYRYKLNDFKILSSEISVELIIGIVARVRNCYVRRRVICESIEVVSE